MSAGIDVRHRITTACAIAVLLCVVPPFVRAAEETPQTKEPERNSAEPAESEVLPDRPLSEIDETEARPPAEGEPDTDHEGEVGPPSPPEEEPPSALKACKEIQPEQDTVLERVRRTLQVTACAGSAWLDGMFGDQLHYEEYRNTRGSVSMGATWSEYDGFDPRLRARVRLRLPQWNQRISAFAGRVGEGDFISDTEGQFQALPTRIFASPEDESVLVGLGYSSPQRTGNDFDTSVGVRVDLPPDPYARARYEITRMFGEHYVFSARETVFWQNSEGFGATTRFNIDRALSPDFLLRWNNIGKWTEETQGLEWFSEVTLFQRLNQRMGIAWQNYINGETDNQVEITRYGFRSVFRRRMVPEWLFMELRAGVSWPRREIFEKREASFEAGFAFEIQFDGEDD